MSLVTFQTISVRSVIYYSGNISAHLNDKMQTKQHAMKKPHSYSNRNKFYVGLFCELEGSLAENV